MASTKKTLYSILRKPKITEKTAIAGSVNNSFVFEVHPQANKIEIKQAVEKLFSVKVDSVRTVNTMGKIKRVGAIQGRRINRKKAYVCLQKGYSLDVIEGL